MVYVPYAVLSFSKAFADRPSEGSTTKVNLKLNPVDHVHVREIYLHGACASPLQL